MRRREREAVYGISMKMRWPPSGVGVRELIGNHPIIRRVGGVAARRIILPAVPYGKGARRVRWPGAAAGGFEAIFYLRPPGRRVFCRFFSALASYIS